MVQMALCSEDPPTSSRIFCFLNSSNDVIMLEKKEDHRNPECTMKQSLKDRPNKKKSYWNAIIRVIKYNLHKSRYYLMPCTFLIIFIRNVNKEQKKSDKIFLKEREDLSKINAYMKECMSIFTP